MKKRSGVRALTLGAVAMLVTAGPAFAGSIQYEGPQVVAFEFTPNGPDEVFQVNQFDDQGGTRILREVILEIEGVISASITVENASEIVAQFTTAVAQGSMDLALGGYQMPTLSLNHSEFSPSLAPSDGVSGSGPDFYDFGTFSASTSDSVLLTNPPDDLSAWIGAGTVNGLASALAGFSVQGPTDTRVQIHDVIARGTVSVTYGFQSAVVPLPPAAGLGLAGLALTGLRRRRRQRA